jgi:hypothetical protein
MRYIGLAKWSNVCFVPVVIQAGRKVLQRVQLQMVMARCIWWMVSGYSVTRVSRLNRCIHRVFKSCYCVMSVSDKTVHRFQISVSSSLHLQSGVKVVRSGNVNSQIIWE